MDRLLPSLRYTFRLLLKSPGFTVTAVLILGFGIGVNTAIFSLIDNVLLKPLPFPNPDRLVQITQPYQNDLGTNVDYPDYADMLRSQHTFETIAVASYEGIDMSGDGKPERLTTMFGSPSMFQVTGSPVVLGRVFTDQEDVPNGPLLVVLSEKCWRGRFHSDPNICGKNLILGEHSFQVIGVVPTQAIDWGPPGVDIYLPANMLAALGYMARARGYPLEMRDIHRFGCYGRMKPRVTIAQAQADLQIIHDNLLVRYPNTNQGYGIRVVSLLGSMVADYSATTGLIAAAVGCLLLIATGNVANLLFARGLQRRRELMVCSVLGATRVRLIRQLAGEAIFLALLGGIFGLSLSFCAIGIIKQLAPATLYRFQELTIDLPALLFVLGVTLLVAILTGVLPAWGMSGIQLTPGLKEEGSRGGTTGPQHNRVQAILVSLQVALACILVIGAGLLVRSFLAAQNAPLGFNPHHLLTVGVHLSSAKYEFDGVRTRNFWSEMLDKVRRLPGVTKAAINDLPAMKWDSEYVIPFTIDGQPDPGPGRRPVLDWQMISSDYFHALQVPVLQGRGSDSGLLVPAIRDLVASIDPAVSISDVSTYDQVIAEKFVTRRLSAFVVTLFSVAALFLSAVGLYGILAYSVGQRTREIGIRIALGAQGGNVLKLVTQRGLQIVGIGLLTGIAVGLVAAHLIQGLLYGVSPIDPVSFGVSLLSLGIAATLACLLPALRAIRINPITALRE